MKKNKIFILSVVILIILIILYFIVYIPFKEKKSEQEHMEWQFTRADNLIEYGEFKGAIEAIEYAESYPCKFHDYKYEIKNAYAKIERIRKIRGSIDDSTMNRIANKYNLNKNYSDFQKITWYKSDYRFYFGVENNGKPTRLHMTLYYNIGWGSPDEVKYIKISTDKNVYTKEYKFTGISTLGKKYDWDADVQLSSDDMEMIKDIFTSVDTVKIRFYGRDGSWDYYEEEFKLDKKGYYAYQEVLENLW